MRIQVLGNGFIASHLKYDKIIDRVQPTKSNIEVLIDRYKPDVLINCIGFCGKVNIDDCAAQKEKTYSANTTIPVLLADACAQKNIKLIHISSGCVFYGNSPELGWKEDDLTNPLSFYSKTKYSADMLLSQFDNVLSYRIRMPISHKNNSRNLINKLKNYSKIIDIPNSVSFLDDIVRAIDFGIAKDISGIYHITNPQPLSAVDVMREYQKYVPNHTFEVIDENELNRMVLEPRSNCILNTEKINSSGFEFTNSYEALRNCMKRYFEGNK